MNLQQRRMLIVLLQGYYQRSATFRRQLNISLTNNYRRQIKLHCYFY